MTKSIRRQSLYFVNTSLLVAMIRLYCLYVVLDLLITFWIKSSFSCLSYYTGNIKVFLCIFFTNVPFYNGKIYPFLQILSYLLKFALRKDHARLALYFTQFLCILLVALVLNLLDLHVYLNLVDILAVLILLIRYYYLPIF